MLLSNVFAVKQDTEEKPTGFHIRYRLNKRNIIIRTYYYIEWLFLDSDRKTELIVVPDSLFLAEKFFPSINYQDCKYNITTF